MYSLGRERLGKMKGGDSPKRTQPVQNGLASSWNTIWRTYHMRNRDIGECKLKMTSYYLLAKRLGSSCRSGLNG